jgi:hypothetical protein
MYRRFFEIIMECRTLCMPRKVGVCCSFLVRKRPVFLGKTDTYIQNIHVLLSHRMRDALCLEEPKAARIWDVFFWVRGVTALRQRHYQYTHGARSYICMYAYTHTYMWLFIHARTELRKNHLLLFALSMVVYTTRTLSATRSFQAQHRCIAQQLHRQIVSCILCNKVDAAGRWKKFKSTVTCACSCMHACLYCMYIPRCNPHVYEAYTTCTHAHMHMRESTNQLQHLNLHVHTCEDGDMYTHKGTMTYWILTRKHTLNFDLSYIHTYIHTYIWRWIIHAHTNAQGVYINMHNRIYANIHAYGRIYTRECTCM